MNNYVICPWLTHILLQYAIFMNIWSAKCWFKSWLNDCSENIACRRACSGWRLLSGAQISQFVEGWDTQILPIFRRGRGGSESFPDTNYQKNLNSLNKAIEHNLECYLKIYVKRGGGIKILPILERGHPDFASENRKASTPSNVL